MLTFGLCHQLHTRDTQTRSERLAVTRHGFILDLKCPEAHLWPCLEPFLLDKAKNSFKKVNAI